MGLLGAEVESLEERRQLLAATVLPELTEDLARLNDTHIIAVRVATLASTPSKATCMTAHHMVEGAARLSACPLCRMPHLAAAAALGPSSGGL